MNMPRRRAADRVSPTAWFRPPVSAAVDGRFPSAPVCSRRYCCVACALRPERAASGAGTPSPPSPGCQLRGMPLPSQPAYIVCAYWPAMPVSTSVTWPRSLRPIGSTSNPDQQWPLSPCCRTMRQCPLADVFLHPSAAYIIQPLPCASAPVCPRTRTHGGTASCRFRTRANLSAVSAMMGHSSTPVTQAVYASWQTRDRYGKYGERFEDTGPHP